MLQHGNHQQAHHSRGETAVVQAHAAMKLRHRGNHAEMHKRNNNAIIPAVLGGNGAQSGGIADTHHQRLGIHKLGEPSVSHAFATHSDTAIGSVQPIESTTSRLIRSMILSCSCTVIPQRYKKKTRDERRERREISKKNNFFSLLLNVVTSFLQGRTSQTPRSRISNPGRPTP